LAISSKGNVGSALTAAAPKTVHVTQPALENVVIKIQPAEEMKNTHTNTHTHTHLHSTLTYTCTICCGQAGKENFTKALRSRFIIIAEEPFDKKGNICQGEGSGVFFFAVG